MTEVNETSIGSCPVAGFGISDVEPLGPATREPLIHSECHAGNMKPFGDRDWKMEITLGGFETNDNFSFPDTTTPRCHCSACMYVMTVLCNPCSLARYGRHTES